MDAVVQSVLNSKVQRVYSLLLADNILDFDKVKVAVLKAYHLLYWMLTIKCSVSSGSKNIRFRWNLLGRRKLCLIAGAQLMKMGVGADGGV